MECRSVRMRVHHKKMQRTAGFSIEWEWLRLQRVRASVCEPGVRAHPSAWLLRCLGEGLGGSTAGSSLQLQLRRERGWWCLQTTVGIPYRPFLRLTASRQWFCYLHEYK